jgi:hypothetical protein
VNPSELAFGLVAVTVLVGLAAYVSWRQVRTLRHLRAHPEMPPEDHLYHRGQARLRLTLSVLMLVLAGLLVGSYFFEEPLQQLIHARDGAKPAPAEKAAQWDFALGFFAYWGVVLLVLGAMLVLVVMDMRAIARFGVRQRRRLRDEFNTTLANEVVRLRGRRNGQQ